METPLCDGGCGRRVADRDDWEDWMLVWLEPRPEDRLDGPVLVCQGCANGKPEKYGGLEATRFQDPGRFDDENSSWVGTQQEHMEMTLYAAFCRWIERRWRWMNDQGPYFTPQLARDILQVLPKWPVLRVMPRDSVLAMLLGQQTLSAQNAWQLVADKSGVPQLNETDACECGRRFGDADDGELWFVTKDRHKRKIVTCPDCQGRRL